MTAVTVRGPAGVRHKQELRRSQLAARLRGATFDEIDAYVDGLDLSGVRDVLKLLLKAEKLRLGD